MPLPTLAGRHSHSTFAPEDGGRPCRLCRGQAAPGNEMLAPGVDQVAPVLERKGDSHT